MKHLCGYQLVIKLTLAFWISRPLVSSFMPMVDVTTSVQSTFLLPTLWFEIRIWMCGTLTFLDSKSIILEYLSYRNYCSNCYNKVKNEWIIWYMFIDINDEFIVFFEIMKWYYGTRERLYPCLKQIAQLHHVAECTSTTQ